LNFIQAIKAPSPNAVCAAQESLNWTIQTDDRSKIDGERSNQLTTVLTIQANQLINQQANNHRRPVPPETPAK